MSIEQDFAMVNEEIGAEDNPVMVPVEQDKDNPQVSDTVMEAYHPEPPALVIGPDGLPVEIDQSCHEDAVPPPLSPETLVCMRQPRGKNRAEGLAKCKYYARMLAEDEGIDRPIIQRWCLHEANRANTGAALCLRDSAIYYCELRQPPDPHSEDMMDAIDERKIEQGRAREFFRIFRTEEDKQLGRTKL